MTKVKNSKLHKEKLIEALKSTLGLITPACEAVGISRKQYYHYYKTDPVFKEQVDEIQDIAIDFCENQLFKKIKEGDRGSILFFMKYRGRKRGYTDSIDITTGDEKINEIKIIHVSGTQSN